MGDEKKNRGSRVLRFAVSSALLIGPMAVGCGTDEVSVNEPVHTINEPPEPVVNEPVDPPPTVNEPPGPQVPEEQPQGINEPPQGE